MSTPLRDIELYAVDYLYGVGTEDYEMECRSVVWVKTRFPQLCVSIMHEGDKVIPAGSRMVSERAKVEGTFGTCYTCESCVQKAVKELADH